eukprot:GFUD01024969.1.p2 GENE.GFUD01024969.1~~GFUD01024969.1.p2  ORF type:complete len:153 (+),score=39.83 GFUD01024969.1:312-770(+)
MILYPPILLDLCYEPVIARSAPHVFTPPKLEGEAGEEDEDILEKESHARVGVIRLEGVVDIVTDVDILAKQDVASTKKRPKSHHDTKEEPYSAPSWSQTSISEAIASKQTIGDNIDHQHGDGSKDPTEVKHIPGVLIVTCRGIECKPPPTEE